MFLLLLASLQRPCNCFQSSMRTCISSKPVFLQRGSVVSIHRTPLLREINEIIELFSLHSSGRHNALFRHFDLRLTRIMRCQRAEIYKPLSQVAEFALKRPLVLLMALPLHLRKPDCTFLHLCLLALNSLTTRKERLRAVRIRHIQPIYCRLRSRRRGRRTLAVVDWLQLRIHTVFLRLER